MTVRIRAAQADDVAAAAGLMDQAGGDVLQFVLDEIAPQVGSRDLLAHMFTAGDNECSHRHCLVAEADGAVVGLANAFPTALLAPMPDGTLSSRERHLKPRTDLNDEGSYRLNMIAVDSRFRRHGIASRLLAGVIEQALAQGYDRVSLHVWADNVTAIGFYRAQGFREIARAGVPWHPALSHAGGSILMRLTLPARNGASPLP